MSIVIIVHQPIFWFNKIKFFYLLFSPLKKHLLCLKLHLMSTEHLNNPLFTPNHSLFLRNISDRQVGGR